MFKKFSPKEDVSGSTSLKSSVQRGVRAKLVEQYPLLTQPAWKDGDETNPAPAAVAAPVPVAEDAVAGEDDEDDEDVGKKGKGKKGGKDKGGKGKGGKKAGKGKKHEEEDAAGEEGEGTLLDELWPKKEAIGLTKCHERINIYTLNSTPLFFNHFDGPFIPTLRLLHKYPALLPHAQIDRGAIKFLLSGANMMAPGFLSKGGILPDGLQKDDLVAIHAEGKEHACGIGKMAASSDEIRKTGKGVAVEVVCWIGDDLWKVHSIGL